MGKDEEGGLVIGLEDNRRSESRIYLSLRWIIASRNERDELKN